MHDVQVDIRPYYLIFSLIVSAAIIAYALYHRPRPTLFSRDYRSFLFTPWRVVTFFCAAVPLIVVAPYTGDPTWDYVDAAFMAALTFFTAPWAVGMLYRFVRGREHLFTALLAVVCWMFTASWSYDLYVWLKMGQYPSTWASNILASSGLYFSGGLFWSLRWQEGEGATFAFMHDAWPVPEKDTRILRLLLWGLPFMLLFGGMIVFFLVSNSQ